MVSRLSSIAFWAVALCFLCFVTLSNADTPRHPHAQPGRINRRSVITKAPEWTKKIVMSPGHQDPSKAPPNPTENLELSSDSGISLDQYYRDAQNATESSAGVTPNKSGLSRRSLEKRGDGPLYCKDRKCPDESCCGPKGICGYGPDYCGKGCTSNCDAKAMCGEYSEEGEMPCGMNLCCSATGWCGTTEVFCDNADPLHKTLPCQAGYGGCNIVAPPSCAKGGGSTSGRTIGYYQSWNVRARKCDTKTPKQLDTTGFTHLFYSFAFIDPISFKVTPAHNDDIDQMREFTDLSKGGKLKTWIAIGGYDMSNENTSTHTTWSDMVSTKANRAAFIESVRDYMDEYKFTGVDLDWEYPGEPKRGGRKLADTRNLSMLLKEMRAAYGSKYGISLTLAPDYWYLRWFDAKAMEPYVDFFGFMAYDLHGSWDSDVLTLGKIIRGQSDIREIHNNTIPLWFAGLDPKKINFGLAMYGRGYTVADKSCNGLGCSFAGPSKKGECTDSDGVMSLGEIKNLIKNKGVKSTYLKDSMMKQIAWDDQWIGYDDEETFAAKKAWADGLCFGGTMVWSIDFQEQFNDDDSDKGPILGPGMGSDNGPILGPGMGSDNGPIKGPGSGSSNGNSDVNHMNTPFTEFRGCTASQKRDIVQSWWDTVEFVRLAAATDFNKKPGTLESRVFGFDVHEREGAGNFINMIYTNILKLYTDKIHGKIRMSCKDIYQTHRAKTDQVSCSSETHFGEVGGYAFSYSEKLENNTIVMCKPFFQPGQELLQPLLKELRSNKEYQKDPHQMNGKTRMLLHEITHLAAMTESPAVLVKDQPLRVEAVNPEKVYGPVMVQRMGMHKKESVRDRSQKNADSYAMYATWKYFEALFGTPDAVVMPRDDNDDESAPADTLECAPTDTNGPVLSRGNIHGGINAWCDSLNQGTISQDDTRKEQVKSFGSVTPGTKLTDLVFSANWVPDVKGKGCPDRTRGTEPKHCKKAMFEVLDSCGGKDGMDNGSPRYGGSQQGDEQCVIWKIEIIHMGIQTRKKG
ncbi:Chitotriosidase-1 [Fusarium oxysporum f. sp. rapae]|uniref:Chitotriosidase-1 n=1 Tax=Fusarium oxysporum f. sp. rapae TaxID=485398 RepID=A0A8J5NJH3_FUSOX|nr:Chitotriosidase-1 [Fusarium oxysporum f. sp. rapae]